MKSSKQKTHMSFRNRPTSRSNRQGGFTLIELVIVVGVFAAAFGLYKGAPFLQGWWGAQGEGQQIISAVNCQTSLNSSPTFGSVTLATMVNNNCFPDSQSGYGTAGASAVNTNGQTYAVAAVTFTGGATGGALQVASPGISSKSCAPLAKKLDVAGIQQIVVGTTTVKDVAAGTAMVDATVATACSAASTVTVYAAQAKSGT